MQRFFVRFFVVIGALFVLACLGQAVPFEFAFYLLFGWMRYLYRVVPNVRVDRSAAVSAVVCLALLTFGLHRFSSWLYRQMGSSIETDRAVAPRWHARWTVWLIGGTLLMFVAGLATVGITHQVAWLLLTSEKLVIGGGASEAARRAQSTNNLKQIGLALGAYLNEHKSFPPAATIDRLGRPLYGWQATILPFMEQIELHNRIDFRIPWDDPRNFGPYKSPVNVYLRPGIDRMKDTAGFALSHYAGNVAVLGGGVPRTFADISDGSSNTIMAGEVVSDFKPWGDPTNWRDPALGINRSPTGFGSSAPGGASFLFVDGSVRFMKNKIDPRVLKALSTPAGGEKVSSDAY
jgi:prepilin-type processing-associated H-X9-DG protein